MRHSPAPSGILLSAGSGRREELSGARPATPSPPAPRPLLGSGAAPLRASSYLRRSGPAPSPAAGCSPRRQSGAGGSCAPSCSSPGRTSAWWGTASATLRLRAPGAASLTSESPAGRQRGGDLRGDAEPPLRAGAAGREGPLAWGRRAGGRVPRPPPPPNPGMPGAQFLGSCRPRGRPVGEAGRGRRPRRRSGQRLQPRTARRPRGAARWARGESLRGDGVSLTAGRSRTVGGSDSLCRYDKAKTNTTELLSEPQLLARQRAAAGTESRGGERARWEKLPPAPRGASGARPLPGDSGGPSPASAALAAPVTARSPLDRGRSVLFGNSGGCRDLSLEPPRVRPRAAERRGPNAATTSAGPPRAAARHRPPGTAPRAPLGASPPGPARAAPQPRAGGDGQRRTALPRRRRPLGAPSGRGAFPSESPRALPGAPAPLPKAGACRAGAGPREKGGSSVHPVHPAPARAAAPPPHLPPSPSPPRPEGIARPEGARGRGPRRSAAPEAGGEARSLAYPCGGRGEPGGSRGCSPLVG